MIGKAIQRIFPYDKVNMYLLHFHFASVPVDKCDDYYAQVTGSGVFKHIRSKFLKVSAAVSPY